MYGDVENVDVSGGHCFNNSKNLSETNNQNYIYSTKKRNGKFPNVSEMEDSG